MSRLLIWLVLGTVMVGCQAIGNNASDDTRVSAETQETIDMLRKFTSTSAITGNPTRNVERAAKSLEAYEGDNSRDLQKWKRFIVEQWRSGAFADAAMTQQRSFPDGRITADNLVPTSVMVYEILAMAYFRVGLDIYPRPLMLPIDEGEIHDDPQYVQAARQVLQIMVDKYPNKTDLKWYLNLCHMLEGTYPGGLPDAYVVDLSLLKEIDSEIQYEDRATDIGITDYSNGGGAVWLDIDGDGDSDLMTMSHDLDDSIKLYRNDGSQMVDVTSQSGIQGMPGGYVVSPADMDNDGDIDVFIGRGRGQLPLGAMPVTLLRNNGDGTFEEVGRSAGMNSAIPVSAADWIDYDNDGWLDLYIQTEATNASPLPLMYLNKGDGTFEDEAFDLFGKTYVGVGTSAAFVDINADGVMDHVSSYADRVQVLHGVQDQPFLYVPATFDELQSISDVTPIDIDNDGDLDLILTTHSRAEPSSLGIESPPTSSPSNRLYLNDGNGLFSPNHSRLGSMQHLVNVESVATVDVDLDGDQDLYVTTGGRDMTAYLPNRLFINDAGILRDATWSAGIGVLTATAGVAIGNMDQDNYPEIYLSGGGYYAGDRASNVLFDTGQNGQANSLTVQLIGTRSNRQGIGSKIIIAGTTADGQAKKVYRWVDNGHTMVTQEVDLPIGLGTMATIDSVKVIWPDGYQQEIDPTTISSSKVTITENR